MKKHWNLITIGVLLLLLSTVSFDSMIRSSELSALQTKYDRILQTLQNQTVLIVELRQKTIPRNFESLDELTQWVRVWESTNKPIAVSILNHTFVLAGNNDLYSDYLDCDDISEAMQRDAYKDGYLMSIGLTTIGGKGHAGCMAIAENVYWFIEPQTGGISLITIRD